MLRVLLAFGPQRPVARVDELAEAARIDGASPMRFFFDMVLPLSKTNLAALFVGLFYLAKIQFGRPTQPYYIFFTGSVTGLVEGSPARYRGVAVGSVGDSYDNALAETINGLYKAEVIWRRGP